MPDKGIKKKLVTLEIFVVVCEAISCTVKYREYWQVGSCHLQVIPKFCIPPRQKKTKTKGKNSLFSKMHKL